MVSHSFYVFCLYVFFFCQGEAYSLDPVRSMKPVEGELLSADKIAIAAYQGFFAYAGWCVNICVFCVFLIRENT